MTKAQILKPIRENILKCALHLRNGELVGMPTETVYGLAAIFNNEQAIKKIFTTKKRPTFDPLIVHIEPKMIQISQKTSNTPILDSLSKLHLVDLSRLNEKAKKIAEKLAALYWPGPLTLVLPKQDSVLDLITSGLSTVAVRMPSHPTAQSLIHLVGEPVVAPSANRFGKISPTTPEAVQEELGLQIDYILDGGTCEIGLESTIVLIEGDGSVVLLRPGFITREMIESHLNGEPVFDKINPNKASQKFYPEVLAPGMLENHYAPTKPMILLPKPLSSKNINDLRNYFEKLKATKILDGYKNPALLLQNLNHEHETLFLGIFGLNPTQIYCLSQNEDPFLAAQNLFNSLRNFDHSSADILIAEPPESSIGLNYAILDRMKRAALKF
jgi:L-threonylcarbamoyladenylate synthase